MADGKLEQEWAMVGEVLAAIYNTVRDAKKRRDPYRGSDFNPFHLADKVKQSKPQVGIGQLAAMMKAKRG